MRATALELQGLVLFEPTVFSDERGHFFESFNARVFADATGQSEPFVQDNQSCSRKNVLRGLHYQLAPHEQGKLVRVLSGAIFDVAVDLRTHSASFGRWCGIELSALNRRQLWVPPGFAHGFLSLADDTEVAYKTTSFWHRTAERSLLWNDPVLGIAWPLAGDPIISEKDRQAPRLHGLAERERG